MKKVIYNKNMNVTFDRRNLGILLNDFYNCTDLSISFFDAKYNLIAQSDDNKEFCTEIRKTPPGIKLCMNSDKENFMRTEREKRTIVYACQAGVTETITPVLYEKKIIGYIIVGRFRDENKIYSNEKAVLESAEKFGIDKTALLELYNKLPLASNKKLLSTINLIDMYLKTIWQEGLIKVNKDNLINEIEAFIAQNIKDKITIEVICNKFYISKNTLYELFYNNFGLSFGDYVIQKRLNIAKQLLAETDLTITEIADRIGFKDYNYFISKFKKFAGATPHVFRKRA